MEVFIYQFGAWAFAFVCAGGTLFIVKLIEGGAKH